MASLIFRQLCCCRISPPLVCLRQLLPGWSRKGISDQQRNCLIHGSLFPPCYGICLATLRYTSRWSTRIFLQLCISEYACACCMAVYTIVGKYISSNHLATEKANKQ